MWSLKVFSVLLTLSYLYVGLPWVLFLAGWLRWYVAWPALGAWIAAWVGMVRKVGQADATFPLGAFVQKSSFSRVPWWSVRRYSVVQVVFWAAVALLLVSLSGAGGIGLQEGDYFKHNAVLKHLIQSSWPVWLPTDKGPFPLVYYLGWYLPAAAIGKQFGWEAANIFLFIWTYFGVLLALSWFTLLVGRCHWMVVGLFFFFSAPDVVGAAFFKLIGWDPGPPLPPPVLNGWGINWYALRWWNWELRWWAGPYTWNYCCQMELLFWVPQQALGAWICTGIMAAGFCWPQLQWRQWAIVPLALSALWSPLVSLGLGPFLVLELFRCRNGRRSPVKQFFSLRRLLPEAVHFDRKQSPGQAKPLAGWCSWPNGAALVLLVVAGLYYAAHFAAIPFSNDPRAQFRFLGFPDWPMGMYLFRLVCFWIVDVASIAGLILLVRPPRKPTERILFLTAMAVLVGLALFRYGLNNDLGMRVSMPWLFVLAILLAKGVVRSRLPPIRRWILWAALALMAATPVAEIYRHLCEMRRQGRWINIPHPAQVQSLWELNTTIRQVVGNDFFFRQYIGSPESIFFQYLAVPAPQEHNLNH
ncbi:MAG: hypothetical protein NZ602_00755 [Thermoguttaceae bacterium]|nr:hypothetical protein [Thermoguttaceae bacterium]MDW8036841.1 hypothetical protein [Thermoguttaceae bacterium]